MTRDTFKKMVGVPNHDAAANTVVKVSPEMLKKVVFAPSPDTSIFQDHTARRAVAGGNL